jgi:hypothetical protein
MPDYSIEVSIPNQGPKGDNGGIPEAPEDGLHYARKDAGWAETIGLEADGSIAAVVQVRRGTAAQLAEIVLNDGEIAVELENGTPKQIRVGDGATAGGVTPSITGWQLLEGSSDDDLSRTNSVSNQTITLFANAQLEVGQIYEFIGFAMFEVVGSGGIKIFGNFLSNALFKLEDNSDWSNAPYYIAGSGLTIADAEDVGFVYFQGTYKAKPSPNNTFLLQFAQQSATAQGTAYFRGQINDQVSYLAYRKLL